MGLDGLMKDDAEGFKLSQHALGDTKPGGCNVDFFTEIDGKTIILEKLRCITVTPEVSFPNYYWNKDKGKFLALWRLTQKTNGIFYCINYEDSHTSFKMIKVLNIDFEKGITEHVSEIVNFQEYSHWFQGLNKGYDCFANIHELNTIRI